MSFLKQDPAAVAAQVASIMNRNGERYFDEIDGLNGLRERSDSARAFTNNDVSQFYNILQHIRQQNANNLGLKLTNDMLARDFTQNLNSRPRSLETMSINGMNNERDAVDCRQVGLHML